MIRNTVNPIFKKNEQHVKRKHCINRPKKIGVKTPVVSILNIDLTAIPDGIKNNGNSNQVKNIKSIIYVFEICPSTITNFLSAIFANSSLCVTITNVCPNSSRNLKNN